MIKKQYKVSELNTISAKDLEKTGFHPVRVAISSPYELFQLASHLKTSGIKHLSLEFQKWHSEDTLQLIQSCESFINALITNTHITALRIENSFPGETLYNITPHDLNQLQKEIQHLLKTNKTLKMLQLDNEKLSGLFHSYFYELAIVNSNLIVLNLETKLNFVKTTSSEQLEKKVNFFITNESDKNNYDLFLLLAQANNPKLKTIGQDKINNLDKKQLENEFSTFLIVNEINETSNNNSPPPSFEFDEEFVVVPTQYDPILINTSNLSNNLDTSNASTSTEESLQTSKTDDWQILEL